ncbi:MULTISPECIES: ABC transporter permease [unclassified Streptomyces]|uniref:ABC transporter permease n=1 Tax=unclassified Streptomyces TaxID=2593676 RepID=UPI000DABD36A|nr:MULTISPECIES: ABC-2 family transporter protein [unclassified Streptomyces]PZT72141.1 hypothetical protein DNK55_26555 [Streptomyces sp. AC1-42T]PZT81538.1 hypothetical protein DNK56_05020 [Streptomyces sp. AC1-42W]
MTVLTATFGAIVTRRVKEAMVYRSNSLILAVGALVQIMLTNAVWAAAYGAGAGPDMPLDRLLLYVTLAGIHAWLFTGPILQFMQRRVSQGHHLFDLLRPVGFLPQMAAHQVGYVAGVLLFMVPALPVAFLVGSLAPPAGMAAGLAYVVSLALGLLIHTLLSLLVGMSVFWMMQVDSANLLFRVISQFFSGAFAPLALLPGWLATVTQLLPFQATTYVPVAIYIGEVTGAGVLRQCALQAAWVAVLALALRFTWSRAVRKVVVQGG